MKECQLCKNCYTDSVETCPKDGMPTVHTIAGEPVLEGKYHLECRLGQGGMGVVYKARHAYLKTQLAIKVILPDLVGNDPQLVTRFRQEALAAAAIRHQNVVAVTDYGVINGSTPFLVMEYVEGEALHDLLTREKRLSPERALDLMSAICAGVGAAHHQGIVHRDLKPLNIMICTGKPNMAQAVKILDFGLAKIKSGELLGSFVQAQTTGLMGSPYYMAPEQWADDEPDARSDIYSLGVMFYQMLAGDVPFKGSSIPAIMKKHISDRPPKFTEFGANVSPELEAAIFHTLEKEKEKRTPTVEQMVAELREAIFPQGLGIHTTSGGAAAASTLNVRSDPPRSTVYLNNVPVGETREDGWITLNGIQSGSHHLRVTKKGYGVWEGDVICDGGPKQVLAQLPAEGTAVQAPPAPTIAYSGAGGPQDRMTATQKDASMLRTNVQHDDTGRQLTSVDSVPPRKRGLLPWLLGSGAAVLLLFLVVAGAGLAYYKGWIFNRTAGPDPKPSPTATVTEATKPDMAEIPGGKFTMGSSEDEKSFDFPEHQQEVKSFWMDRTEVTNQEYYEFVQATGYEHKLPHWENDRPLPGEEKMPVRYVSFADVSAFAEWRSKRDGVQYRLPTEIEWEYAARNGAKGDRYPWGNEYDPKCALLDQPNNNPVPVGFRSCPNDWGVHDLIGNVFEWTSSTPWIYPGSKFELRALAEPHYMVRGGGAFYRSTGPNAITSIFREAFNANTRSAGLGFRLVKDAAP